MCEGVGWSTGCWGGSTTRSSTTCSPTCPGPTCAAPSRSSGPSASTTTCPMPTPAWSAPTPRPSTTSTPSARRYGQHPPPTSVAAPNGGASPREGGLELGPQPGSEDIAAAADQQGHLVGDHGHITGGGGQHREAGTVADRHDHQQAPVHLDHRLFDQPTLHTAGATLGQAGQPGGDGGELVGFGPVQALGGRDRKPVGRHHQRVGHPWGAVGEVADQPAEVAGFGTELWHSGPDIAASVATSSRSEGI